MKFADELHFYLIKQSLLLTSQLCLSKYKRSSLASVVYIDDSSLKSKLPMYYLIFFPYNNRPHLRYFQQTSFGILWSPTCADHDWWSQSSLEGGPWTAKETRNVIIPSHLLSPNLSIRKQQRLLSYSYYISTIPKIYLLIS